MRIKTTSLKPGVSLGTDVFSADGQLLLPKGERISVELLDALIRRDIQEVIVNDTESRFQSSRLSFEQSYVSCLAAIKSIFFQIKLGQPLLESDVKLVIEQLAGQVGEQSDVFRQIRRMKGTDDYLFTHTLNVSLLSMIIGTWMGFSPSEVFELGQAGLLHDAGKAMIPEQILNKPSALSDEECFKMKEHSLLGFNLIKDYSWINADVANAVLFHHEREDGQGYPYGIKEKDIGIFAQIVAIADTYDALTSNRVYCPQVSPFSAVEVLWKESFGRLNARIAKVFYDRIANFYVGNEVLLSNNERGTVVYIDPSEPTRPIIRAGERFYSLVEDRSLYVVEVFDE